MKCPVCNDVRMREVEKDNVLIDVCPDCKGVWLDRGELEKLLQGVHEVRQEYERMEQQMHVGSTDGRGDQPSQPAPPAGASQSPTAGGYPSSGGYGGQYNQQPQGGFGGGPAGAQGYPSAPPPQSGYPGPGQYGQQQGYGYGHGQSKYGYDKYGRPYKKKKTVLDVFGDLFD